MSALAANTHLEPRHGDPCVAGAGALAKGRLGRSATRRMPVSNLAASDDSDTVMHASTWVHDRQCIRNHHDAPEHPIAQALTVQPKDGKVFKEIVQQLVCSDWIG
ncbi:hypothetical protein ACN9M1_05325 [Ralstonia sp. R-29]|uniref:hypothetical protein n=1 Tax=Ralstonia sp. R-29 TaxID=3404059 RepID=UPI003CF85DB8